MKSKILGVLTAWLLMGAVSAQATLVGFEDIPNTGNAIQSGSATG